MRSAAESNGINGIWEPDVRRFPVVDTGFKICKADEVCGIVSTV